MPYMKNGKRDYTRQGALVDAKPEARAHRAANVKANRALVAAGVGHKGDGLDAAHVKAFSKGGDATLANTKLEPPSKNRSFKRNAKARLVSETSSRERS